MPLYPVINKVTGEKQELSMTVDSYTQWRKDNPDWDKDWNAGVAAIGEVGDWQNKLKKSHPGWNDVLRRVKQMPGSNINTL